MEESMTAIYIFVNFLLEAIASGAFLQSVCIACRIKCLNKAWSVIMFTMRSTQKHSQYLYVPDTEYGLNDTMNLT